LWEKRVRGDISNLGWIGGGRRDKKFSGWVLLRGERENCIHSYEGRYRGFLKLGTSFKTKHAQGCEKTKAEAGPLNRKGGGPRGKEMNGIVSKGGGWDWGGFYIK